MHTFLVIFGIFYYVISSLFGLLMLVIVFKMLRGIFKFAAGLLTIVFGLLFIAGRGGVKCIQAIGRITGRSQSAQLTHRGGFDESTMPRDRRKTLALAPQAGGMGLEAIRMEID